jgi:hypothetical protein
MKKQQEYEATDWLDDTQGDLDSIIYNQVLNLST